MSKIVQGWTDSFKKELLQGLHDFSSDTFKLALFSDAADLHPGTTAYSTSGEIAGTGYDAGGAELTAIGPLVANGVAYVGFSTLTWEAATITARAGLIYNSTVGNRAIAVIDFGSDRISQSSDFSVKFPQTDSLGAIIRIG